jgi:hypothetical protein
MHRCHLLTRAAIVVSVCAAPAGTSAQGAIDRGAAVAVALGEFRTPNGPIVEVVGGLGCRPRAPAAAMGCSDPQSDSVLVRFARDHGAALVDGHAPDPVCRWDESAVQGRKGLRLSVHVLESAAGDGAMRINVETRCTRPTSFRQLFLHSVSYPFHRVGGDWKGRGNAITVIS